MAKENIMSDDITKADSKTPRTRSPNYPSIDLKTAVAKLTPLFNGMKRHSVGVETAVQLMEYKYTSSSGKLALGAMRSYGFFENERSQTDSLVKLSTRALDIAVDYEEGSEEWWVAVKKAALSPKIHADLWNRYGTQLPPDTELRRYLIRELKFNDNAVGPLIAEYKTTIEFAKLSDSDTIEDADREEDEDDHAGGLQFDLGNLMGYQPQPPAPQKKDPPKPKDGPTMRDLPITLPSLAVAVLRVPVPMSEADFMALSTMLTAFKPSLVNKVDSTPPETDSGEHRRPIELG